MKLKRILTILSSIFLLMLIIYLGTNITKKLTNIAKSNDGLSTESVFQAKFEEKIYSNIHDLLAKLLPESAFMISVHTDLPDKRISEAVNMTPKKVVTTNEDKIEGDINSLMVARPSSQAIRLLNKHGLKLPGLVPTKEPPVIKSLPGFPMPDARDSLDDTGKEKDQQIVTFSESEEEVYFNKTKRQTFTNDTKINTMRISVVIDEYTFKKLNLDQNYVTTLIENVVGLNTRRGDLLTVELTEFQGFLFKLKKFIDKQKEPFAKLIDYILKINWILIIILGILVGIVLFCIPIVKKMQAEKARLRLQREEEERLRKKKALLELQKRREEFKEKRTELTQLSESKPEIIAHHIVGWIKSATEVNPEVAENES